MSSAGARKLCVYFFWGGYVQEEEDGKVSYQGGGRDCVLISESMTLDEARTKLMRKLPTASKQAMLWYTLKFDRKIFLPLDGDDAVEAMFMGNEEHAYVYMGGDGGPLLRKMGEPEPKSEPEPEPEPEPVPLEEAVAPDHNGGCEEKHVGGIEEQLRFPLPDEGGSEKAMSETAVNCEEQQDDRVEKGSSAECGDEGVTDEGVEKQLGSSANKDDMVDARKNNVVEVGRNLLPLEGYSSSSSSEGLGTDQHTVDGSAQSDGQTGKLNIWRKEIVGAGQVFPSAEAFRTSIFKYAIAHRFNYKFERNCKQRIVVRCSSNGCPFRIVVRGSLQRSMVIIKSIVEKHVHEGGDETEQAPIGKRRLKASMVAKVIEGKLRATPDYSPVEIMKDLETELGVKLSYTQSWRAREHVRTLVQATPDDNYKVLPWMCDAIIRSNPGSTAVCELDVNRFKRLFVAYGACLSGFRYCRPVLFLGASLLTGPCKGAMLTACALDADNRILPLAYAIVSAESDSEWLWFLEKLKDCLGELRPVLISERHPEIVSGVSQVFGKEFHAYCLRHLCDNFVREASMHNLRKETTKVIVKEMFNRIACATTEADYKSEMEELRRYKAPLADWIEANEPERWAASKFPLNRWGCMDTSLVDPWAKWMIHISSMPIPCLITAHLEKLAVKTERKRRKMATWANGVGSRIEKILTEIKGVNTMESILTMQRNTAQVYTLSLSNWKRITVDLGTMACTCSEWQMRGLPCTHAMVVIQKLDLNLYDFVYNWYTTNAQSMVYNEKVEAMKALDMPGAGGVAGLEGGDGLVEDGFHGSVLPPNYVKPVRRTPAKRRRRDSRDRRHMTCSKCREVGHTRRSCTKGEASSDVGDTGGDAGYGIDFDDTVGDVGDVGGDVNNGGDVGDTIGLDELLSEQR